MRRKDYHENATCRSVGPMDPPRKQDIHYILEDWLAARPENMRGRGNKNITPARDEFMRKHSKDPKA